jgi:hypothetical protein
VVLTDSESPIPPLVPDNSRIRSRDAPTAKDKARPPFPYA